MKNSLPYLAVVLCVGMLLAIRVFPAGSFCNEAGGQEPAVTHATTCPQVGDPTLPDAASPLAGKDRLILPTSFGAVACLDARTGKVHWEQEFGKGFNSSPILVNDRVYLMDLSGTMQIFRMDRKFEQVAEAPIGEAAYATRAFVGGRIYIRGLSHLFCIAERR